MYRKYYALSEKPFNLTPDPDFLYLSRNHKEALAHLTYGVESRSGFVMVTGEVGAGKTTLLRTLIRSLGDSVVLSQVTNTRVSYKELLELILEDYGVNPRGLNKTALISTLNEFLLERYREGRSCVVIVDEAQNLTVPTLEGLRMLSNLETEKSKLVHVILSGQPGLRDLIDSPDLEQLRQRITVRYHLGPLSVEEVGEYIDHRIGKVAQDPERAPRFPEAVLPIIHRTTGGIPRLVNVLCDAALLHGYVEEQRVLGPTIVNEVADQIRRDQEGTEPVPPGREAEVPSEIDQRIAEIEAKLDRLAFQVPTPASSPEAPAGTGDQALALARKEKALQRRAAELAAREADFNQRVAALKDQWKRRMQHLEEVRRGMLSGEVAFPPLRVLLFDPDPRVRNALVEWFAKADVSADSFDGFDGLLSGLQTHAAGGWFAVAVVGSGSDDAGNTERVKTLAERFPHVPTIYLSDVDLSRIRRGIFEAGANYFLEKPGAGGSSFAAHRQAMDHLRDDLLRVIRTVYRQYKAFFESFRPKSAAV